MFYDDNVTSKGISSNEVVKIKFEVDINPPPFATFEHKYRLLPVPYEVKLYDVPSLFAGKIHAVICRAWQNRVMALWSADFFKQITDNLKFN
jgi:hypothetical protein